MNNFNNMDIDINEVFEDNDFDNALLLENFEDSAFQGEAYEESFNRINFKNSINNNNLNVSALCCDEEISGYDKLTGKTWIYPTNYPVRDYQFNIIKASILKNTLVSLPTGLGKTFIAAVIMYNFYRWYPLGKIVFTAPTRPLVAQQIEACYNIIAIPPKDTIEMTGHMHVNTRKAHWETKRVFFATPQVIYNDIKSGICPGEKIRCLVIDEAHKARGNYAYCQIVSTLTEMGHKTYRILALSATPGSKVEDVITVVKNLHIAHLELRAENCIDVAPYSHTRKTSTVVVKLGPELTLLRQQYVKILDGYARSLIQLNILPQNIGNLSKGRIMMLYKDYQCKERSARHSRHNHIMKVFTTLIPLYHGLDLLVKHGSRTFLNFFDEHPEKSWIQSDDQLTALLERLRDDLGINPLSLNKSLLPDGTVPEVPKNLCFGHPKFYKLKEIMLEHFEKAKKAGQDTKAIVFCEYRHSVNLVHCLLLQCRPLINPQTFVGQGASGKDGVATVSQKQQLRAMRDFRAGACNALVATCVAEEGLDVGSVDLILCFDTSTRSPIRLVQRCGRTGRERSGQVFILVTEGSEHQTLLECMRQRDGLNKKILQSKEVENNLYKLNPRMVPRDFMPECRKMYITVAQVSNKDETPNSSKKRKKGQKDLKSMLLAKESNVNHANKDRGYLITKDEFLDIFPNEYSCPESTYKPQEYFKLNKGEFHTIAKQKKSDNLTPWLECQRTLHKTVKIGHSRETEILSELLQYCDAKRSVLPSSTQNPTFSSQNSKTQSKLLSSPLKSTITKRKQKYLTKSPNKKDSDIRAFFSSAMKPSKSHTKLIYELGIYDGEPLPTPYIDLLVDLALHNANVTRECYICQNICNCSVIQNMKKSNSKVTKTSRIDLTQLNLPDISLLDDFTSEMILECGKLGCSQFYVENKNNAINETEHPCDVNIQTNVKLNANDTKVLKENFDIGDIEDIFAESSPEVIEDFKRVEDDDNNQNSSNPKETLGFFGLKSIEDIFADYDESDENKTCSQGKITDRNVCNVNNDFPVIQPSSPSILSSRQKVQEPTSPIICGQVGKNQSTSIVRFKNYSTKNEKLLKTADNNITQSDISNDYNESMFTVTQLVEMINNASTSKSKDITLQAEPSHNKDYENERSSSPIIMTQTEKRKIVNISESKSKISETEIKKLEAVIILDSDSESNDKTPEHRSVTPFTDINDGDEKQKLDFSPTNKRKLSIEDLEGSSFSPYFSKRQKLNDKVDKTLTLRDNVLAALTSKQINKVNSTQNTNCALSIPSPFTRKENQIPGILEFNATEHISKNDKVKENGAVEMLRKFRSDLNSNKSKGSDGISKLQRKAKKQVIYSDSDDDFVSDMNGSVLNKSTAEGFENHKVRKKKNKRQFLDEEAELSDDVLDASGDELTDESVGSIIDFICDDNETHNATGLHAHYLRSVRSPVKGAFKIPQLPIMNKNEVFSQAVEEDAYEMDSFCVDSQFGLTQVKEESELDIAEKLLEEKQNKRKNIQPEITMEIDNGDGPVIRRKRRIRQITSDSDDSS